MELWGGVDVAVNLLYRRLLQPTPITPAHILLHCSKLLAQWCPLRLYLLLFEQSLGDLELSEVA